MNKSSINNLKTELKPNSEQNPIVAPSSPTIANALVVGSPFLSRMKCFNKVKRKWVENFILSNEGKIYETSSIGEPENFDKHIKENAYLDDLDLTDITTEALILRYIGSNDKNGNEIYEGNIIEYFINPYLTPSEAQELVDKNEKPEKIRIRTVVKNVFIQDIDFSMATIIGNIFENPELLLEGVQ